MKTYTLKNLETGEIVELPEGDAEKALVSGQFAAPAGQQFDLLDHEGQPVQVGPSEVGERLRQGFALEAEHDRLQRQYGDRTFEALGLGALRGLSFGLSDVVLTEGGHYKPEELSNIEEANPIASGIGEVASLVTPLGPASGLVKGATRAGRAIGSLATGRLLPKALKGATEGALYGAGHLISEEALGRANANAESIVGSIGVGAVLGAGVETGLAGLGIAGKKLLGKAKQTNLPKVFSNFRNIAETTNEKSITLADRFQGLERPGTVEGLALRQKVLSRNLPDDFVKDFNKLVKETNKAETVVRELREGAALRVVEDANQQQAKKELMKIIEEGNQEWELSGLPEGLEDIVPIIKKVYEAASKDDPAFYAHLLNASDDLVPLAKDWDVAEWFLKRFDALSENPQVFPTNSNDLLALSALNKRVRKLREVSSDFPDGETIFNSLRTKRDLFTSEHFKSFQDYSKASVDLVGELEAIYSAARGSNIPKLIKGLEETGKAARIREQLARDKAPDYPLAGYIIFDALRSAVGTGGASAALAVGRIYQNPERAVQALTALETIIVRNQKRISSAADRIVQGGRSARDALPRTAVASFLLTKPKDNEKPMEKFSRIKNDLDELRRVPLDQRLENNSLIAPMIDAAPATQIASVEQMSKVIQFLDQIMPRNPNEHLHPLQRKWMPSDFEVKEFVREAEAVLDPIGTLERVADDEHLPVEGIKQIYPEIFSKFQADVLDRFTSADHEKNPLSFDQILRLETILDVPLTDASNPEVFSVLQQSFVPPEEQEQGAPNQLKIADLPETQIARIQSR